MTSFSFRSRKWHPPLLSAKLPACLTCLNPANTPPVSPVFTVAQLQSTPWPPLASSSVVVINSCIDLYKKASSLRSKLPITAKKFVCEHSQTSQPLPITTLTAMVSTVSQPCFPRPEYQNTKCPTTKAPVSGPRLPQSAIMPIQSTIRQIHEHRSYVPTLQPHRSLLRPPRCLFTSPLTQHPANPSSV